jgi:TetR/AcrR family transcriptional regulator, regulator of cefoperazone and chloramphenicol sensitivity
MRNREQKGRTADESKKRLIEAGVELFGRYSFDGVSTRNLADNANVNLASIQYYFGGKEGLYLAVARHIVQGVRSWMAPLISRTDRVITEDNPDKATCFRLLSELLDHVLAHVLSDPEAKRWMGIFMREQVEPTRAFDVLYEGIMWPIHGCFCRLIAGILDLRPEDEETKVRAYATVGPILMFHISRAEIGRAMNWDGYGPEQLAVIRRVILDHVRATFEMPRDSSCARIAAASG